MSQTTEPYLLTLVTSSVLIPSLSVLFASACAGCIINALFNCFFSSSFIELIQHYWRVFSDNANSASFEYNDGVPIEIDPSLTHWSSYESGYGSTLFKCDNFFEEPFLARSVSVADSAFLDSIQTVRVEAQRIVFAYNPKYMIISTAKSLLMLVVMQYHFDSKGGWDRLVMCSAANVMSGLLTPVLEYGAFLLLPLDSDYWRGAAAGTIFEPEEPTDSVFIAEVLFHVGRLELEDLEKVLIQGGAFIVFGAVLIPAVFVFCTTGAAYFFWLFFPLWGVYFLFRHLYYRNGGSTANLRYNKRRNFVFSLATEFGKAASLKIITLLIMQWTLQCSFLFGLVILQGGSFVNALQLEAEYQLWSFYDPLKMGKFQWLCFTSQLLF